LARWLALVRQFFGRIGGSRSCSLRSEPARWSRRTWVPAGSGSRTADAAEELPHQGKPARIRKGAVENHGGAEFALQAGGRHEHESQDRRDQPAYEKNAEQAVAGQGKARC